MGTLYRYRTKITRTMNSLIQHLNKLNMATIHETTLEPPSEDISGGVISKNSANILSIDIMVNSATEILDDDLDHLKAILPNINNASSFDEWSENPKLIPAWKKIVL